LSRGAAGSADDPKALGAAHDLATLHTQMQKYHLALPLMQEVLAASRYDDLNRYTSVHLFMHSSM
jgi:hypothetical protein